MNDGALDLDVTALPVDRADPAEQPVVLADELRDEGVARRLVELVGCRQLLDPPRVEHGDAVGHGQRLALVVGDVDHGQAEPVDADA